MKATKFCEIFTLTFNWHYIGQNQGEDFAKFVVFSEYMNFKVGTDRRGADTLELLSKVKEISKVISVQEPCTKYFAVQTLEFELLQTT